MSKQPTSWKAVKSDPRVKEAWSEQDSDDGFWVTLKPGFADMAFDPHNPRHTIHEFTIREILSAIKEVRECKCESCTYLLTWKEIK